MNSFTLDLAEFGIDRNESRLEFELAKSGIRTINLSVRGDKDIFAKLSESEDSEWFWAIYPPNFYLRGFPVPNDETFKIELTEEDSEGYDTAIYMMEHFPIESMTVSVGSDAQIEVQGKVEFSGKMIDFAIHWAAAKAIAAP